MKKHRLTRKELHDTILELKEEADYSADITSQMNAIATIRGEAIVKLRLEMGILEAKYQDAQDRIAVAISYYSQTPEAKRIRKIFTGASHG